MSDSSSEKWVLQLCHSYGAPFDDVARQWRVLFADTEYKVLTVFLTGEEDARVKLLVGSDEVRFMGYDSKDLKGLKRKQIQAIRELHRQYNFGLVVAHRYKPVYIACHLPSDVKIIGVAHAYGVFNGFWRRRFVVGQRRRLQLVGVSTAIRNDIIKALPAYPADQVLCFYNRIDTERVRSGQLMREEARSELGLPRQAYVIGNVGRLHPDKDQQTLIHAFALAAMNDAVLVIIGTGRLEQSLKDLAAELQVSERVIFTGRVQDAWRYFRAFDVFALSSCYEPFGMVLLEAMCAELPIVSADSGGAPEILDNEQVLFATGNAAALAQLLKQRPAVDPALTARLDALFSDSAAQKQFESVLYARS